MKNYFSKEETQCRCGCGGDITDGFREFLNDVRRGVGHPITLTSGFRCKAYDKSIGGKGAHTTGKAADVACSGSEARNILAMALHYRVQGVGVSQKGDHSKRFLHFDMNEGSTRPWVWSY